VHGANRLASNSLLEGLVFSRRIAQVLPGELRPLVEPARHGGAAGLVPGAALREVQEIMTSRVGVLRNSAGLTGAVELLGKIASTRADAIDRSAWETTNVLTISLALAEAALRREETRGSHWREDFPDRDDATWAGHFDARMSEGVTSVSFAASPATDPSVPGYQEVPQ
jgi:L-aspartate oxidase